MSHLLDIVQPMHTHLIYYCPYAYAMLMSLQFLMLHVWCTLHEPFSSVVLHVNYHANIYRKHTSSIYFMPIYIYRYRIKQIRIHQSTTKKLMSYSLPKANSRHFLPNTIAYNMPCNGHVKSRLCTWRKGCSTICIKSYLT